MGNEVMSTGSREILSTLIYQKKVFESGHHARIPFHGFGGLRFEVVAAAAQDYKNKRKIKKKGQISFQTKVRLELPTPRSPFLYFWHHFVS